MRKLITVDKKDHILLLSLSRPEVRNALSTMLLLELQEIISSIKLSDTRCLIITGSGDKVFCAGADLKERSNMSNLETLDFLNLIGNTFNLLANLLIPTIALINADAFGGGLELALACDLRITHEKVLVGLTETSLGIIPVAGGTQRLARLIGVSRALDMILCAKKISGQEAFDISLVNYLVPKDQLLLFTYELAQKISNNGPLSLAAAKNAVINGLDLSLKEGLELERNAYKSILFSEDRKEGINAFLQKRNALFIGK